MCLVSGYCLSLVTSDATGRVGDKNSSWLCLLFVVLSRVSSLSMLTSAHLFFLTLAGSCEPLSPDRPQSVVPCWK